MKITKNMIRVIIGCFVMAIVFLVVNRLASYIVVEYAASGQAALVLYGMEEGLKDQIAAQPIKIDFDTVPLLFGAIAAIAAGYPMFIRRLLMPKETRKEGQHGSAQIIQPKALKKYECDDDQGKGKEKTLLGTMVSDNNIVLSKNVKIRFDGYNADQKTHRSNNVLVIGGTGTLKTRSVIVPNCLQLNGTHIISDPKLELYKNLSKMYEAAGYRVVLFNSSQDMMNTARFNPFAGIESINELPTIVKDFMECTTGKDEKEDWFVKAEQQLLSSMMAYMIEALPPYRRTLETLLQLKGLVKTPPEGEKGYKMPYEHAMNELEATQPNSLAVQFFEDFKDTLPSPRTAASIISSINVRLTPFMTPAVREALSGDDIKMERLDKERTALFVATEDSSSTYQFITTLFYRRLINRLRKIAARADSGRVEIPVQFILDEFKNSGKIPDFDKLVSVSRSKGLSFMPTIHNISQITDTYGKELMATIVQNCETKVFLGGDDEETNKFLETLYGTETGNETNVSVSAGNNSRENVQSHKYGRPAYYSHELGVLDNLRCTVKIRGENVCEDDKYRFEDHPNFRYTGYADPQNINSPEGYKCREEAPLKATGTLYYINK